MSVRAKHTKMVTVTEKDPRWTVVIARDPSADGQFYYSVKTTGVYCSPSSPARIAKPENEQLHDTQERMPKEPDFAPASAVCRINPR